MEPQDYIVYKIEGEYATLKNIKWKNIIANVLLPIPPNILLVNFTSESNLAKIINKTEPLIPVKKFPHIEGKYLEG